MKKHFFKIGFAAVMALSIFSCKKGGSGETTVISVPLKVVGQPITTTTLPQKDANGNAIPLKGTMLAGKTYDITGDVTINAGDTLYVQPGVTVLVHGDGVTADSSPTFYVNGTLVSDGTKDAPNIFTVAATATVLKSNSTYKDDVTNDPAFKGYWGGFQCGPNARLLLFRWTHLEYLGSPWGANAGSYGAAVGDPKFGIYMSTGVNVTTLGKLIVEDSWFYGTKDDCIGKCENIYVSIMRNTFIKTGSTGGEGVNFKDGVFGDMAYNLSFGGATNGLKIASVAGKSTIVNIYNNTLIQCGFRQTKATRNGSINTETNTGGYIYNNIIVNCKQGLRITYSSEKGKPSDTLNTSYGNSLTCIGRGTPMGGTEQYMVFIEANQYTLKKSTDFNGYVNGAIVTTGAAAGTNTGTNTATDSLKYDPLFVNYDVKANSTGLNYRVCELPAGYDFHLKTGSPAIGAGVYPGGTGKNAMPTKAAAPLLTQYGFPMKVVPAGGTYGATITPPNKDMGAFPTDGTGNQHKY